MARAYVACDRDQLFLLPASMREWLPAEHLAWFVLEIVAELDTSALHARHPNDGAGRPAYNPDMVLALVVYSYCQGVMSSRHMARLCEVDVAYRVIAGNHQPHHGTISRFVVDHEEALKDLFVQVLALCRRVGMVRVGVVALDGTKVGADAALGANRSRAWLQAEVDRLVREGRETDAAEDQLWDERRGDELPETMAPSGERGARIRACLARLRAEDDEAEAQAAARAARRAARRQAGRPMGGRRPAGEQGVAEAQAALERLEAQLAARQARRAAARAAGRRPKGAEPKADSARLRRARQALAAARQRAARKAAADHAHDHRPRANLTDPDSRILQDAHGGAVQGYNAQAVVSADHVVVAADVTNAENDYGQLLPMIAHTRTQLAAAEAGEPGLVLADAGYCTEENLAAPDLPDLLVATGKLRTVDARTRGEQAGRQLVGEATAAMTECLRHPAAAATYRRRGALVEPVFGTIKDGRKFRRFRRRGLAAAQAQWQLVCLTHNVLKLFGYLRAAS